MSNQVSDNIKRFKDKGIKSVNDKEEHINFIHKELKNSGIDISIETIRNSIDTVTTLRKKKLIK